MNFDQLFNVIRKRKENDAMGGTVHLHMEAKGCGDCDISNQCDAVCILKKQPSEIEKMFCMAFVYKCQIDNVNDNPFHATKNPFDRKFRIEREVVFGKYRCDFLCEYEVYTSGIYKKSSVVVELDSQKWHETTEEQRRYEKKRERFIQSRGINILRFTGKEVMDDPILCAKEVENFLRENLKVVSK